MPRGGYANVNWFVRAARVVPVIAAAALVGGMIGGFAIYAIDSAFTWEPVSQPRPDARAEGQASAVLTQPQTTKPVRIVGGAIPDPSAGMSAPPPAPQQRNATSPAQISAQLLTPKPLGPASQLQPQTATAAPSSGAPQPQNQTANQAQAPIQAPAQAATTTQSRWPDALSRARQNPANAANTNSAQQQTAPPAAGQASEGAASKNGDADRRQASGDPAATPYDQDRSHTRYGRYSRRHWRGGDDDAASSSRRQDARTYDRLYDSYGARRDRSYGNPREQSDTGGDRDDAAAARSDLSRSEMRRPGSYSGRDTRYRSRWRPDDNDRNQAFDAGRPRPEPFWGGGFFRRGNGYEDGD